MEETALYFEEYCAALASHTVDGVEIMSGAQEKQANNLA